tara:strand:+ start:346 stop:483 length:138 start_codon:yes stop_codon:yes gene_type:complete
MPDDKKPDSEQQEPEERFVFNLFIEGEDPEYIELDDFEDVPGDQD